MRNILKVMFAITYTESNASTDGFTSCLKDRKIDYRVVSDKDNGYYLITFIKPESMENKECIDIVSESAEILESMRKENVIKFARITTYFKYKLHYTYIDKDYNTNFKKELISILEENI